MTAAQAPDIEALAKVLWEAEKAAQPSSVAHLYAERYEDEEAEDRRICEAQAAAVLAAGFVRPEDVAEAQAKALGDAANSAERYASCWKSGSPAEAALNRHASELRDRAAALRPVDAPEGGA